jgi:hypothetical protein
MLSLCKRLAAIVLMLALASLPSLPAADQPKEQPKDETGFVSLFNGKDLTGWRYTSTPKESLEGKTETPDGRFTVKNGVIVAEAKDKNMKGGIKDLYTLKDYNDPFILRMQFKASEKADSGVYVRGPQQQVRDFPRRNEYKHVKNFKTDDWNDLEFVVTPNRVRFLVNGKEIDAKDKLELVIEGGKAVAKVNGKESTVTKYEVKEGADCTSTINGDFCEKMIIPLKGGIGLQAEVGEFAFKNIRIKELKDGK